MGVLPTTAKLRPSSDQLLLGQRRCTAREQVAAVASAGAAAAVLDPCLADGSREPATDPVLPLPPDSPRRGTRGSA